MYITEELLMKLKLIPLRSATDKKKKHESQT